jgi:hypothetical protein
MNRPIAFALATCAVVGLAGAASAQQAYYSRTYQTPAPAYDPAPAAGYEPTPGYTETYRTEGPGYTESYSTTTTTAPIAPPAVREEIVPAPPDSAERVAWVRGRYEWNGAAYYWVPGHYIERPRPGLYWEPGRWVAVNGRWEWYAGHWAG